MIANVENLFINSKSNIAVTSQDFAIPLDPDSDKVVIILKQIVRDWTVIAFLFSCWQSTLNIT
jgi:hypothetical protein